MSAYENGEDAFSINDINLFMFLYADDFVLFANSLDALQQMLNNLYTYSQIWNLSVN